MRHCIKYISAAIAALPAFCACDIDDADVIPVVELGAPTNEYVVSAAESTFPVTVYSNSRYDIEILDGADSWLHITGEPAETDSTLIIYCEANQEFKRKGRIVLRSAEDSRSDTVTVKQKGWKTAYLSMGNASIVADGGAGVVTSSVKTNIPFSYMTVEKEYADENASWIQDVDIVGSEDDDRTLKVSIEANPSGTAPRAVSISLSFTDGWGDRVVMMVNLLQKSANNTLGEVIPFERFIDKYATGKEIQDYVILEGYVVSNSENGNAGENEQKTTSAVDYSISERTVYLESADGARGVSILMNTSDDNVFEQYDQVQILMHGAVATLKEEPLRCDITGVTKSMITSRMSGTKSSIPVKELYIRDLTDNDVYTYVTLKDVEIPVRKGSLTPVNEGYTIATAGNRFTQYPRLLRDINGDDIYMTTNTVCTYRSDGTRLPYGSGKISGVIVHEAFPRMEWRNGADPAEIEDDPTLGNIGRYQIRHQNKSDVWEQMSDDFEDGFSALLTEYRYWVPSAADSTMRPSYGTNGWMDHTYSRRYTHSEAAEFIQTTYLQHMESPQTYCYLGPVGNGKDWRFPKVDQNNTNVNGLGIILDLTEGRDQIPSPQKLAELVSYNPDGTVEWGGPNAKDSNVKKINGTGTNSGKSWVPAEIFTGFINKYWWDYETERPYAWIFNFSTAGISTDRISMQIAVMNADQGYYTPRYWKAEWSLTPDQSAKADSEWHLIANYTVPDVSTWSNTLFSSTVAYKQINFDLPLDILGHEDVYIRLCPVSDVCSSGADYADAVMKDKESGTSACAIEYFAIRYNK